MTGILLVDKPVGITSHDVVDRIRRAARQQRVGHTGTLDPAATGLLIICLGKATRLSELLTGLDKTYEGTMRLGVTTGSYDLDGEILEEKEIPALTRESIQEICTQFTGHIEQIPPMISAVKIGGERLYKRARKGETIERPPRKVHVQAFDVLEYTPPNAALRVQCASGTYVRALCHDAGQALGCGAALASLRRTQVGKHQIAQAIPLDQLQNEDDVAQHLIPMGKALDLPHVTANESGCIRIASGTELIPADYETPCPAHEGWIQIKNNEGQLLALGRVQPSALGATIYPKKVFI